MAIRHAKPNGRKGFTLIELLIVIGIIGILAAIVLVAVDPAKRLRQARDARRFAEVNGMLNAILNYAVDNRGSLPSALASATNAKMIGTCASGAAFTVGAGNTNCTATNTAATCADLSTDLVDTYIASIPVDPRGSHATTNFVYDAAQTGYYAAKTGTGRIEIGSCNPEDPQNTTISVKR